MLTQKEYDASPKGFGNFGGNFYGTQMAGHRKFEYEFDPRSSAEAQTSYRDSATNNAIGQNATTFKSGVGQFAGGYGDQFIARTKSPTELAYEQQQLALARMGKPATVRGQSLTRDGELI